MRRISSLLMSLALVASGVVLTATAASAAPGDITQSTSATLAPSAITGATPSRLIRLPKTDSFLAFGRIHATAGAHNYLWKLKNDLTIDTTFGAIDLGGDFAYPISAESTCVSSGGTYCAFLTMVVSETLDKYAISYTRQLKGTTTSTDQSVMSIAIGSLTTGTVTARSVFLSSVYPSSGVTTANYAAYSTNELGRDQCVAEFGAAKNSAPFTYANTSSSGLQFRPDGSLFFGFLCRYSTQESIQLSNQPGALKDYSSSLLVGLKISGSSLVVDTTFGSNGRVVTFNSDTACLMMGPGSGTVDTSVTSLTSTSPYFVIINNEYARSTTLPSWHTGGLYTSFDGCSSMGMGTSFTNKLTPYTANGNALTTQTINTGDNSYVSRWVIDPLGRWNGLLRSMGMTPSTSAIRLVNGILDATLGTNGLKSLSTLPSTITVGGATVRMSYSISGVVSAGNDLYFTGVAQTSTGTSMNVCASTATVTQSYYPYLLSFDSGLLATYGTNGLGAAGSISAIENAGCNGSVAGTSYVDTTGRIGYLTSVATIGSQTAGYLGFKWDAAQGVTSGGDGDVGAPQTTTTTTTTTTTIAPTTTTTVAPTTTSTIAPTTTTTLPRVAAAVRATPNRIDAVVYSKKLPAAVQTNTALKVLSAKDAVDLDIRTITPKVCVALTTSVLLVNSGRCSVQIIDQDTKAVVRSMSTTVKASDVRVGSVPTVASPVMFTQASAVLNAAGLAQVQKIAKAAKNASRVVVIGHAASLTNISEFRFAISRDRAKAVKNALVKAGVTATIEIVSQSDNQPVKTPKTEAAQSKNRRADVYIFR